ncbi:hypothetical protein KR018_006034 [Drosophila ironensis]|nr:hypothetical protein KR018_006034 [Drosophila ironensis]
MGSGIVVHLARRYGAVIFFPAVAVGSIYADWSHTRDWKIQEHKKHQQQRTQLSNQG